MDTPNDIWADHWKIGLHPDEERALSRAIIELFKTFWEKQALSSKSKTTQRRYANGLAAIGGCVINRLFNHDPVLYDPDKSVSDILLNFVDEYEGPLIHETENDQREIDLVSRKLFKFINRKL